MNNEQKPDKRSSDTSSWHCDVCETVNDRRLAKCQNCDLNRPTVRARLDEDGTAKPLTEIVAVMPDRGEREHTIHAGQATHYIARPLEHRSNDAPTPCEHLWRVDVHPAVSMRCIKCAAKGKIVPEVDPCSDKVIAAEVTRLRDELRRSQLDCKTYEGLARDAQAKLDEARAQIENQEAVLSATAFATGNHLDYAFPQSEDLDEPRAHLSECDERIRAEVEGRIATTVRIQTRERCAQELYDLARWCRNNKLEARARHTESAAWRLQGVDDDGNVIAANRPDSVIQEMKK